MTIRNIHFVLGTENPTRAAEIADQSALILWRAFLIHFPAGLEGFFPQLR